MPGAQRSGSRLLELDGLRAVAVIGVILFHYLQRYAEHYPYGATILPPARFGWLGVDLFFIISGFAIALTLTRTRSPIDFVARRLARLVPAMLVCATISFLVIWTVDTPFTRAHRVGLAGFAPSLTFTDPWLWHWLLPDAAYIDGAYWSLFVEVRFYFWAALVYYALGHTRFLPVFLTGALAALALYVGLPESPAKMAAFLLFFPHDLPLFCVGMLAHAIHGGARGPLIAPAFLLFAGLSIASVRLDGLVPMLIVASFMLLFLALLFRPAWLRPLTHPALTMVGACSYSLYLIHQNVGVAIITLLPAGQSTLFYLLWLALIFAALLALALLIFRLVELPAQERMRAWLARRSAKSAAIPPVAQAAGAGISSEASP